MDDSTGIFDDTDPRIEYAPTDRWIRGGTPDEHNAITLATGAQARIALTGTSIAVYGTLIHAAREVVSTYTLDSARPVTFPAPHWALPSNLPPNTSTSRPQQLFFRSPALPDVLVTGVVADSGFWTDYFTVTGREPGLLAWAWDETTLTLTPATTMTTVPDGSATSAPAPRVPVKNTPTPTGAIAGGVVALAAAVGLLRYWRRRRRGQCDPPESVSTFRRDAPVTVRHDAPVTVRHDASSTPGPTAGQYTTRGGTAREKGLRSPQPGEEGEGEGGTVAVDSPPAYDSVASLER